MKIIILGEMMDLNSYIRSLNNNRYSGNDIKQSETDNVAWQAKKHDPWPDDQYPVHIHFDWYCKDKRKDIDNVAFAKKFCNDGLVRARILEDDSRKYVSSFSDNFFIDKENPRVEITITKAGQ